MSIALRVVRRVWAEPPPVQAAFALWSDPVVFLLAGLNLTFGFSAAFVNGPEVLQIVERSVA